MSQRGTDPIQDFSSISRAATELRVISHHLAVYSVLPAGKTFAEKEQICFDSDPDWERSWFALTDRWIMFSQGENTWGIPFDAVLAARIRELGAIFNSKVALPPEAVQPQSREITQEEVDRLSADTSLNAKIEPDPLCYKCGSARLLMSGSLGVLCPDCYDEAEGFL